MTVPGDPQDCLIRGIVAKWASLTATTLAGIDGPHRDERPSKTTGTHPYAVIKDAGCDSTGHTCLSEMFESEVELRVYHKTPEQASVEIAKVDGVFSSQSLSLSVTGIDVMGVRLLGTAYTKPDQGIWYAGLRYRFQISRAKIA